MINIRVVPWITEGSCNCEGGPCGFIHQYSTGHMTILVEGPKDRLQPYLESLRPLIEEMQEEMG